MEKLAKVGKEGGLDEFNRSSCYKGAVVAAQREFERIEIRDRLVNWSQSEDLVELLEDLKDGKRQDGLTGSRISRAARVMLPFARSNARAMRRTSK